MKGPRRPSVTWPLTATFLAFPVWWVLGFSAFIWPVITVPVLTSLIRRRRAWMPTAMLLFLISLAWILLSGFQLPLGTKTLTFAFRFMLYACSAGLFLYVYTLPRASFLDKKILRILTIFWLFLIIFGYAGILLGSHTFTPPFEHVMPHSLRKKAFVQELVQPTFAQVQSFLGYPVPRPAAPFPYTNEWGASMAVLLPVALASAAAEGPGRWRKLIIAGLLSSVVPMVVSLNRGMFLSLAVGIFYVVVRFAFRGRAAALLSVLALVGISVLIVAVTPLGHLIISSFSSTHGHSNSTRLNLYGQAIQGANQSPILGHGAPQQIAGQSSSPPIGTQGQLWMLLYSNGYPAALFFVAFVLAMIWQTRKARGTAGLWLHTVPLVALVQIAVYGWLPVELQVVMIAGALAYRRCWRFPVQPATPAAAGAEQVAEQAYSRARTVADDPLPAVR